MSGRSGEFHRGTGNDPINRIDPTGTSCEPEKECPKPKPQGDDKDDSPEAPETKEKLPEIVVTATRPKDTRTKGIEFVTDLLCAAPAFSLSLEGQIDVGWISSGHSASFGYKATSHGQFAAYFQHGSTEGPSNIGGTAGLGTKFGVSGRDMPAGVSDISALNVSFKGAHGLRGGGGDIQIDDNGGEISGGFSYTAGYGGFINAGRMTGKQLSTPSICQR